MSQSETEELKALLKEKEAEIIRLQELLKKQEIKESDGDFKVITSSKDETDTGPLPEPSGLSNNEIMRYSRQLILPELGVRGQLNLKKTSVLIVGAGGLGCPAAIYLAAAGIGRIGVVDYDEVELSNLHRQILHTEQRVGVSKALSIASSCHSLNSQVDFVPYQLQLDSTTAKDIIQKYDIVLDATDNVATRYLLNDACVLLGKPLVSGSALRFEGQLTVYNCNNGPCYRCLFPKPPPPETVTNCSDGGVLGVVPGIIGSLQALEAIKIAAGIGSSFVQRLLMFDALDGTFRSPKLRPRSKECVMCGDNPLITELIDYEQFCGAKASDKDNDLTVLDESYRISAKEYSQMVQKKVPHILLDVRTEVELDICKLPHPVLNIPYPSLERDVDKSCGQILDAITLCSHLTNTKQEDVKVICVCRRGNDSQLAVEKLRQKLKEASVSIVDITRGLYGWQKQVDHKFPLY